MPTNQLCPNPNFPLYFIVYAGSAPNPGFYVLVDITTMLPSPTQHLSGATLWRTQAEAAAYLVTNIVAIGPAEIRATFHAPIFYQTVLPVNGPE